MIPPGGIDFDADPANDPNFGDYNIPPGGEHDRFGIHRDHDDHGVRGADHGGRGHEGTEHMTPIEQIALGFVVSAVLVITALWLLLRVPEPETPPFSSCGE